jgi:hypothetical protein
MDFFNAMEAEHLRRAGCNEEFETVNYRIKRRVLLLLQVSADLV